MKALKIMMVVMMMTMTTICSTFSLFPPVTAFRIQIYVNTFNGGMYFDPNSSHVYIPIDVSTLQVSGDDG